SRFTKGGKIPAFTLAEVLVTLGIIGVVAAMTLPMLAKNYQFYVRQQQFKKAYAELTVAMQKAQFDLGENIECHYQYKSISHNIALSGNSTLIWKHCFFFYDEIFKNLKILKQCENNSLDGKCISNDLRGAEVVYAETQGGDDPDAALEKYNKDCPGFGTEFIQKRLKSYVLISGAVVMPYIHNDAYYRDSQFPLFLLDINGHKGPNKWGYDVFLLEFARFNKYDSHVILQGTTRCHPLDKNGYYSRDFVEYLYGRNAEL
ncbi:type II secretion system protein, partial [bacterium]|nr:type II secretion system protein [bacterium]